MIPNGNERGVRGYGAGGHLICTATAVHTSTLGNTAGRLLLARVHNILLIGKSACADIPTVQKHQHKITLEDRGAPVHSSARDEGRWLSYIIYRGFWLLCNGWSGNPETFVTGFTVRSAYMTIGAVVYVGGRTYCIYMEAVNQSMPTMMHFFFLCKHDTTTAAVI